MTTPTRRSRAALLGPRKAGPIAAVFLAWTALVAAWIALAPGRVPDVRRTLWRISRAITDDLEFEGPVYRMGRARAGGLMVVGDSRSPAALIRGVLDGAGLGPTAYLSGPSTQLLDALRTARGSPCRRMVVCLSPLGLWHGGNPTLPKLLANQRRPLDTRWVDERLNDALEGLRHAHLLRIAPEQWYEGWFGKHRPTAQRRGYLEFLRKESQPRRAERLAEVEELLRDLQADGWTIAAVRVPASKQIMDIEDEAFDPEDFERMCARLDVPFRDLRRLRYRTFDGSHMLPEEGRRLTEELLDWLREVVPPDESVEWPR